MKLKKIFAAVLAFCAMFAAMAATPQTAGAEPYTYINKEEGYSIMCPTKPLGVLPASVLHEDEKGSVLVFPTTATRSTRLGSSFLTASPRVICLISRSSRRRMRRFF